MNSTAVAAYVGVVVADLDRSTRWYASTLGCPVHEEGSGWSCLRFPNGSVVELSAGDPTAPALAHPSYSTTAATPVIAGYAVEDPWLAAQGLRLVRRFPDWIVVAAADTLRLVLNRREVGLGLGLVGFHYTSPRASALRDLLASLGVPDQVDEGPEEALVPIISARRDEPLHDPDGNGILLVKGF